MNEIQVVSRTQRIVVGPNRSVSVVNAGPPGPPGPTGPPGASALGVEFQQATPSLTWNITHNLGRKPSVSILDAAGNELLADVQHVSNNAISVYFSVPTVGSAVLI